MPNYYDTDLPHWANSDKTDCCCWKTTLTLITGALALHIVIVRNLTLPLANYSDIGSEYVSFPKPKLEQTKLQVLPGRGALIKALPWAPTNHETALHEQVKTCQNQTGEKIYTVRILL